MPAIPLPFITLLLLLILFFQLCWQKKKVKPAICFTALCILMMLCTGLRWSSSWHAVAIIQPILATLLPLVASSCFYRSPTRPFWWRRTLAITGAAVLIACLPWREFSIDLFIALLTIGTGLDLLFCAKTERARFTLTSAEKITAGQRAAMAAGGALCFSGSIDLLIAIDYALLHGQHVALIIASAQAFSLPAIAFCIALAGQNLPAMAPQRSREISPACNEEEAREDERICQQVTQLVIAQTLWRDPDLTLDRLARKAGIPARKISRAINRLQQHNVSQMFNSYRITEAQRLLAESDLSITEIMLDTGFRTKSNFNHEFLKLSGCNPGDYRRAQATTLAGQQAVHPAATSSESG